MHRRGQARGQLQKPANAPEPLSLQGRQQAGRASCPHPCPCPGSRLSPLAQLEVGYPRHRCARRCGVAEARGEGRGPGAAHRGCRTQCHRQRQQRQSRLPGAQAHWRQHHHHHHHHPQHRSCPLWMVEELQLWEQRHRWRHHQHPPKDLETLALSTLRGVAPGGHMHTHMHRWYRPFIGQATPWGQPTQKPSTPLRRGCWQRPYDSLQARLHSLFFFFFPAPTPNHPLPPQRRQPSGFQSLKHPAPALSGLHHLLNSQREARGYPRVKLL